MSTPFFSICLPCYNGAKTIQDAVNAVIGQTFVDWHLTVIDDRSTDATWEILKSNYGAHPKIKLVLNNQNLGLRGNLNRCLEFAHGEWLGILCQDDAYRLHAFETIHRQISSRKDVVLWTHGQLIHAGSEPPVALPVYRHFTEFAAKDLAQLIYKRGNPFGVLTSYFVNLPAVRDSGVTFVDGEMLVDVRFYLRLLMSNLNRRAIYWPDLLTLANVDETTASYRLGKSGKAFVDNIAHFGDLAALGWPRSILAYQLARLLHCSIKFRREFRRNHALAVSLNSARSLLRELLHGSRPKKAGKT